VRVESFPPVIGSAPHTLILGSMPGVASLEAARYYAHPRNVFWRLMGDLVGARPELPYGSRLARLQAHGLALWDVMAGCERRGSLDADIVPASVAVNDFASLFSAYPGIRRVFFNGAAAEKAFRQHVLPCLCGDLPALARLPSTSPAHAALAYPEKLAAWRAILAE
jgi:hypoxanthine-DNA glycosylase